MISIVIIDDNRMVREGIWALLDPMPDFRVAAAGAGPEVLMFGRVQPQVVLLDFGLRKGDSLRTAERIRKECPDAALVVMGLLPAQDEVVEFVSLGATGFIMRDATLDEVAGTIRSVAEGSPVLPPQMTGALFSRIADNAVSRGATSAHSSVRMTPREREVVNLIAEGLSNKQIAARLHIATHTVKSHVRNIMEKLTLHTRLQIAAYVRREEEGNA